MMLINSYQINFQQNYNPAFGKLEITRAELEALLAKDKTIDQIARKYNVTSKSIFYYIKKFGLKLPSEKFRERFQNEALPLLEQGISYAKVRQLTGINEQFARKWFRKTSDASLKDLFNERLKELVKSNYTDDEIADILFVNIDTVKRKRYALGIKRQVGRRTLDVNWNEVLDALKNGKTVTQIIKEFSIPANIFTKKIKELTGGITPKKIEQEYKINFIQACLEKGDSVTDIAEKLQVRREPLYKFIKDNLPEWVVKQKKH